MTMTRNAFANAVCELLPNVSEFIVCMRPANERRRYCVTPSLIRWAHTHNDPCCIQASSCYQRRSWLIYAFSIVCLTLKTSSFRNDNARFILWQNFVKMTLHLRVCIHDWIAPNENSLGYTLSVLNKGKKYHVDKISHFGFLLVRIQAMKYRVHVYGPNLTIKQSPHGYTYKFICTN